MLSVSIDAVFKIAHTRLKYCCMKQFYSTVNSASSYGRTALEGAERGGQVSQSKTELMCLGIGSIERLLLIL
jgi:hypothetical protein